jgi:hypothetical protein
MTTDEILKIIERLEALRKASTSPRMDMEFSLKLEPIILEIATALRDKVKQTPLKEKEHDS